MANFYGTARSNYFQVKDADAFEAWAAGLDVTVMTNVDGKFGIFAANTDDGCFPSVYAPEDVDEDYPLGIAEELAKHLADGEVCVLMEAGAEKHRYITAWAVAFDNTGKQVSVHLSDIYEKAHEAFGVDTTDASY